MSTVGQLPFGGSFSLSDLTRSEDRELR